MTSTLGCGLPQVGLQYLPNQGSPPVVRSGMYYLPSGYKKALLPVVVVFHGLAGNGTTALSQNWVVRQLVQGFMVEVYCCSVMMSCGEGMTRFVRC